MENRIQKFVPCVVSTSCFVIGCSRLDVDGNVGPIVTVTFDPTIVD